MREGRRRDTGALMGEDELTLARVSISSCFNQTPLHLASMLGHLEFAKSLLSYERGFASRLDSQGRSPLHLASANGHANIVKLLLGYDEKMCGVRDEEERTPLHLAVMNGQLDSVRELMKVSSKPDDHQELGTILHLCVLHNRLNVLILILESNKVDLSNIKDEGGNTILHSAAALRRMQILKYLVKNRSEEEMNVLNKKGLTALEILAEMPKDAKTMEIKELLISAGTLSANKITAAPARTDSLLEKPLTMWKKFKNFTIFQQKLEHRDETLLIAATVIAAMAYTSAISPPGGVAGIDATTYSSDDPWYAGYYLSPGSSLGVKLLLGYDEKMCGVRDEEERTPLHLAVMNGQLDSVRELMKVSSKPDDQELGTILHLCVLHNRLNVLILILESNKVDLSNMKDEEGNTILHSAAALRRMQIVKYLVINRSEEEMNVLNKKGLTALGITEEMPKDAKTMEIKELLISAGTLSPNKITAAPARTDSLLEKPLTMWKKCKNYTIFQQKLEHRDETLLIAATVIAAMAYTSAISPPGGVAGIDATTYSSDDPWYAGYYLSPGSSLLAYFYAPLSNAFWRANTISFMAALSVIFIYVTGASLKQKLFVWLIRAAMWVTLSAMIIAYEAAVRATTPKYNQNAGTLYSVRVGLYSWMVLMLIAIVAVLYRSVRYILRKIIQRKMATTNKINTIEIASTVSTPSHNNV